MADKLVFVTQYAGQMKYLCLVLFLVFAVAGCKPKEQVIGNKVVESGQALITGQIFIVTKGGENVVLGDVKVALLDAGETRTHFNSKALEWSNALAIAQAKVDQATANFDAIYRDELVKLAAVKNYQGDAMQTIPTGTQEWDDAFERSQQVEGYIRDLHKVKESTDAKQQLDAVIEAQADLWDEINWPSADHFWPRKQITTTDSEGRFKFIVPASFANLNLMLFAKAERPLTDNQKENWYTMSNVTLATGVKQPNFTGGWWMSN